MRSTGPALRWRARTWPLRDTISTQITFAIAAPRGIAWRESRGLVGHGLQAQPRDQRFAVAVLRDRGQRDIVEIGKILIGAGAPDRLDRRALVGGAARMKSCVQRGGVYHFSRQRAGHCSPFRSRNIGRELEGVEIDAADIGMRDIDAADAQIVGDEDIALAAAVRGLDHGARLRHLLGIGLAPAGEPIGLAFGRDIGTESRRLQAGGFEPGIELGLARGDLAAELGAQRLGLGRIARRMRQAARRHIARARGSSPARHRAASPH